MRALHHLIIFMAALVVGGVAAAPAWANPREYITFEGVPSVYSDTQPAGGLGQPTSSAISLRQATFSGGYAAQRITVQGTLTSQDASTWLREARIYVTPPGATQSFVLVPFAAGAGTFTTASIGTPFSFTLPDGPYDPAGVWTFQFFDSFDDGTNEQAPEEVWDSITITMDDIAIPWPAQPDGAESTSLFSLPSDGVHGAPSNTVSTLSFFGTDSGGAAYTSTTMLLSGQITVFSGTSSFLGEARIGITPPGGSEIVVKPCPDDAGGEGTTLNFGPVPILFSDVPMSTAGDWTIRFYETVDDPGIDAMWNVVSLAFEPFVQPADPAGVVDLGTLSPGTITRAFTLGATTSVQWYTFTLAGDVSASARDFLDIDTRGSALSPLPDTQIALFNSVGVPIAGDDDTAVWPGAGGASQLSFGSAVRAAASGANYDGRNGALAAGTYYLAVASNALSVDRNFSATSSGANTGPAKMTMTLGSLPPATITDFVVDLGLVTAPGDGSLTILLPNWHWVKFTTTADASDATGYYVDIDNENGLFTLGGASDTLMGLYTVGGDLVAFDDDSGTGSLAQLSFGDSQDPRPAVGSSALYDGRNGTLPAGTYYLLITGFPSTIYPQNFQYTTTADADSGFVNVRVLTNIPSAGPRPCNLADIVSVGQQPPPDGMLTGDDYVAFINAFFTGNLLADIVGVGQSPPADGLLTGDDYVAFINAFFTGCR